MATTTSRARVNISHLRLCDDSWWELAWTCSDPDHFRFIVGCVKAIPPQRRSYDATRKVWRVASAGLLIALDLHIPGLAQQVQAIMEGRAEPRAVASALPPAVERAYLTLHLLPSAPRALVEASRRVLARQHHPDHGGDARAMVAVNTAADAVLAWIDRRASTTHQPDPSPPSGPSHRRRASAGRWAAA